MQETKSDFQPEEAPTEQPPVDTAASLKSPTGIVETTIAEPAQEAAVHETPPVEKAAPGPAAHGAAVEEASASRQAPPPGEQWRATLGLLREKLSGGAWAYGVYALLAAGLIIVQHRGNISRLLQGKERKLGRSVEP